MRYRKKQLISMIQTLQKANNSVKKEENISVGDKKVETK